jgi:hypothetical protein
MNSIDTVIELYKRDVDLTLIDAALQRTVEEPILALEEFERFREELHGAVEKASDPVR